MFEKIKELGSGIKEHPFIAAYVVICAVVVFWWFNLDISLFTKIWCSVVPLIGMVIFFKLSFKLCDTNDIIDSVMLVISFCLLSLIFSISALCSTTKQETVIHKPMSIIKEGGNLVVLSGGANVYKSELAILYIEPDSNICIVQTKRWNEFGNRISDNNEIGKCK